jgi:hypothetical protein
MFLSKQYFVHGILFIYFLFYIQFHLARWLSMGLDQQGGCTSFAGSNSSLMQLYDSHDPCTTVGEGLTVTEFTF